MRTLASVGGALLCLVAALPAGCSSEIYIGNDADAGGGPLVSPSVDGGITPSESGAAVGLCPSNECPAGRVTCPNDPFPCSVDLSSDDDNCGACGVRCPHDDAFVDRFSGAMRCTGGTCGLVCLEAYADCNGLPEDGCEVKIAGPGANDVNNCGACGNVCDDICVDGACGCPGGGTMCPDGLCHDLDREDDNCGACGNVCPESTDPPFPPEWNMIRACRGRACNQVSCAPGQADCNGDASKPDGDGCETSTLFDADNCGGCGNKCAPGETMLHRAVPLHLRIGLLLVDQLGPEQLRRLRAQVSWRLELAHGQHRARAR